MFFDDKKKIATTIMGKRNGEGERIMGPAAMTPEQVKTEAGEVDPLHLAAQDIIGAHHEKSPVKLMEAMSNFIDLHHAKNDNSTEDMD